MTHEELKEILADLERDRDELLDLLDRRQLSDDYLAKTGQGRLRSELSMGADYEYGIVHVLDDYAAKWLDTALRACRELEARL